LPMKTSSVGEGSNASNLGIFHHSIGINHGDRPI
jgi:hypothetical protein